MPPMGDHFSSFAGRAFCGWVCLAGGSGALLIQCTLVISSFCVLLEFIQKTGGGTPVGLKEKLYTFLNERKKEPLHEYATVLGAKYGVLWHGYMEINTAFGV